MRKLIDCESIKTIVDITKNKTISNLEDGLYAIDRKDGWVREKDAGFLRSIIIPSGAQGGLQEISCVESTTTTVKQSTTIFGIDFIKASLTQAYGETVGKGQEITVKNFITAPEGKDIFLKAQTVYRKYELIRIKNRQIIDQGIQYKSTSYAISKIEYNFGTKVNQNQLYEKTDRNILGDSDYATTSFILQQNSVGIYF